MPGKCTIFVGYGKCKEWKIARNMTAAATERSVKWHYNNDYG